VNIVEHRKWRLSLDNLALKIPLHKNLKICITNPLHRLVHGVGKNKMMYLSYSEFTPLISDAKALAF